MSHQGDTNPSFYWFCVENMKLKRLSPNLLEIGSYFTFSLKRQQGSFDGLINVLIEINNCNCVLPTGLKKLLNINLGL